ncbi:DHH family phosphoesterase [Anaerocolumna sp. MB42-C2]|uniref:DHH family phosphoesterase n=1 Tax=Anaerocolumna sp. MB42-C2 TaxID=3070997 RepID=UPI0027E143BB|nr:DHH family phosphoesterase [Anaerocolumna sp. MB42-C2]WMJ85587.1 DHH family phosphoesterase [Anaerocolumna sp. MB42-C2]
MTKLEELLSIITKDLVYIQMHNYPDQDALASAYGLQVLLEVKGIKSTICYDGQIDKYNTLKMIELLHIDIYNNKEFTMEEEDEIILVDGQMGNVNMVNFIGKKVACIDHHPKQEVLEYRFYDIRSEIGACASLIAEYFVDNKIEISMEIATALCYGIKMDTANLSRRASDLDIDMFCLLYKKADKDILFGFDHCSLRKNDLIAYQEAISNLKLYGRIGIARIGDDCSEAIIGSISDFLLTVSEVDFTLVYSYRVGGLKFSVRSESKTVDAGKVIKEALSGFGDGGGHATMAAGFLPNLKTKQEIDKMACLIEQRVIELVMRS